MWTWLTMSHMRRGVAPLAVVVLLSGCARYRELARQRAPQAMQLSPVGQRPGSISGTEPKPVENNLAARDAVQGPVPEFGAWQSVSRRQHLRPLQLSDGRLKQHPIIQPAYVAHPEPQAELAESQRRIARVELLPPPPKPATIAAASAFGHIQQTHQIGDARVAVRQAVHQQPASERTDIVQQALLERTMYRWQAAASSPPSAASPNDHWADLQWRGVGEPGAVRPQAVGGH